MPKTIRNMYDKSLTYENLMEAHNLASRNKRYKKEIILFNLNVEENIENIYLELKSMKYQHGNYKIFYIKEPKLRKIESSSYKDRIIHRWYVDSFMKSTFMKMYIYNSYACIEKRGTHKAVLDLQKGMKHYRNKYGEYYILKCDISKFFYSIKKDILMKILLKKIKDRKIAWITSEFVYSSKEDGIPIGNYTSQIFANIYLNELDQYVKYILKIKKYYRYMDDFIFLFKSKIEAKEVLKKVEEFLKVNLKLKLNNKTQIFKNTQGVNFCGYKINEYRIKLRDRGKKSLKNKVKLLKSMIKKGEISSTESIKYLSGHRGYIKIANVKNLTDKLFFVE